MASVENLFCDDFERIIAMDLYSSITQFTDLNYTNINSLDSLFQNHHQKLQDSPGKSPENLHNFSENSNHNNLGKESKKRKALSTSFSSSKSNENITTKRGCSRRGKRLKKKENEEEEKEREVVHVRAKRGQATDSHSLAERIRRGKINERLKCLQEMVPGCYKAMGMATMLDEIINYVQSLQNQIEFLSMKITVASSFHDFNSETNIADSMQHRAKAHETVENGRQVRDVHLSNCSF